MPVSSHELERRKLREQEEAESLRQQNSAADFPGVSRSAGSSSSFHLRKKRGSQTKRALFGVPGGGGGPSGSGKKMHFATRLEEVFTFPFKEVAAAGGGGVGERTFAENSQHGAAPPLTSPSPLLPFASSQDSASGTRSEASSSVVDRNGGRGRGERGRGGGGGGESLTKKKTLSGNRFGTAGRVTTSSQGEEVSEGAEEDQRGQQRPERGRGGGGGGGEERVEKTATATGGLVGGTHAVKSALRRLNTTAANAFLGGGSGGFGTTPSLPWSANSQAQGAAGGGEYEGRGDEISSSLFAYGSSSLFTPPHVLPPPPTASALSSLPRGAKSSCSYQRSLSKKFSQKEEERGEGDLQSSTSTGSHHRHDNEAGGGGGGVLQVPEWSSSSFASSSSSSLVFSQDPLFKAFLLRQLRLLHMSVLLRLSRFLRFFFFSSSFPSLSSRKRRTRRRGHRGEERSTSPFSLEEEEEDSSEEDLASSSPRGHGDEHRSSLLHARGATSSVRGSKSGKSRRPPYPYRDPLPSLSSDHPSVRSLSSSSSSSSPFLSTLRQNLVTRRGRGKTGSSSSSSPTSSPPSRPGENSRRQVFFKRGGGYASFLRKKKGSQERDSCKSSSSLSSSGGEDRDDADQDADDYDLLLDSFSEPAPSFMSLYVKDGDCEGDEPALLYFLLSLLCRGSSPEAPFWAYTKQASREAGGSKCSRDGRRESERIGGGGGGGGKGETDVGNQSASFSSSLDEKKSVEKGYRKPPAVLLYDPKDLENAVDTAASLDLLPIRQLATFYHMLLYIYELQRLASRKHVRSSSSSSSSSSPSRSPCGEWGNDMIEIELLEVDVHSESSHSRMRSSASSAAFSSYLSPSSAVWSASRKHRRGHEGEEGKDNDEEEEEDTTWEVRCTWRSRGGQEILQRLFFMMTACADLDTAVRLALARRWERKVRQQTAKEWKSPALLPSSSLTSASPSSPVFGPCNGRAERREKTRERGQNAQKTRGEDREASDLSRREDILHIPPRRRGRGGGGEYSEGKKKKK